MKRALVVAMLLMLALQAFRLPIVYGLYLLQKEYITQKYCINKARPELLCSGKCFVTRQMREMETPAQMPAFKYVEQFSEFISAARPEIETSAVLFIEPLWPSQDWFFLFPCCRCAINGVFHPPDIG